MEASPPGAPLPCCHFRDLLVLLINSFIIDILVIHPAAVTKSELWVDVERVAASAAEWYAQSLKVKHSEACPCALTIVTLPDRPDMEALLREVATLRAKGDAMLPVNAATATIAFGRAAQAL